VPIPDEVWAAMAELQTGTMYWLVQWTRHGSTIPMYYMGMRVFDDGRRQAPFWADATHRAVRFESREAAQAFMEEQRLFGSRYQITHHVERNEDEPQAEGAEVHQGGVPAVQAPQEAGDADVGQAAVQSDEEVGCDCAAVESPPRRIEVTVKSCTGCPFNIHVLEKFETNTEGEFLAGWYCAHPKRRTSKENHLIASYDMVHQSPKHVVGLDTWLRHHERATFPHTCPLPKPNVVNVAKGRRALDLG
jgi:hypothetical protein